MANVGTLLLTLRISITRKRYRLTCNWLGRYHIVAQGLSLDAFADLIMADAFECDTPWATEVTSATSVLVEMMESSKPIEEGKPFAVSVAAACDYVYFDLTAGCQMQ